MTRILYIDDEDEIREIAELSLEMDPDFEVLLCASGREALAVAPQWKPALILLDVMMPHMDGPATLAALRDHAMLRSTPVVFITARTQAAEREALLALGANGVIGKPFDPMTLAATVRDYLR
ncbi:response regulator [Sphingomonas sp. LHG3406-1]|uniref:response regulator n=1 Tax=Sphingomonas sp. LHG3406-1 TaxID=2804617 RepID=UPI002639E9DE|nr:response regulator [Sphingomonas sp. LHG3406-1]